MTTPKIPSDTVLLVYKKGVGRIHLPQLTLQEVEPLCDGFLTQYEESIAKLNPAREVFFIIPQADRSSFGRIARRSDPMIPKDLRVPDGYVVLIFGTDGVHGVPLNKIT